MFDSLFRWILPHTHIGRNNLIPNKFLHSRTVQVRKDAQNLQLKIYTIFAQQHKGDNVSWEWRDDVKQDI